MKLQDKIKIWFQYMMRMIEDTVPQRVFVEKVTVNSLWGRSRKRLMDMVKKA